MSITESLRSLVYTWSAVTSVKLIVRPGSSTLYSSFRSATRASRPYFNESNLSVANTTSAFPGTALCLIPPTNDASLTSAFTR